MAQMRRKITPKHRADQKNEVRNYGEIFGLIIILPEGWRMMVWSVCSQIEPVGRCFAVLEWHIMLDFSRWF